MIIDLLREFGPAITAIAFFIWRDWKREERNSQQNEELNRFIRVEFADAMRENTAALRDNGEAIRGMVEHCRGARA